MELGSVGSLLKIEVTADTLGLGPKKLDPPDAYYEYELTIQLQQRESHATLVDDRLAVHRLWKLY
jgi:hypothetical protein